MIFESKDEGKEVKKYLTYDDVNIVPKYSELNSREDVNLTSRFTKLTELQIPIVASPMDTVTELDMANEMMDWGGVGVIHRFNSIEEQSLMMKRLHKDWKRFFDIDKDSPHTLDDSYTEYVEENGIPHCNIISWGVRRV